MLYTDELRDIKLKILDTLKNELNKRNIYLDETKMDKIYRSLGELLEEFDKGEYKHQHG